MELRFGGVGVLRDGGQSYGLSLRTYIFEVFFFLTMTLLI